MSGRQKHICEVRKTVADREAASGATSNRPRLFPVSDERREQIISAMSAAGIFYDEIDSYEDTTFSVRKAASIRICRFA